MIELKERRASTKGEADKAYTVLIVDDMSSNLQTLYHILKHDYTVKTANSGILALQKAAADKPDLILMDIMMPGMDGYEVLSALQESEETHDIPVIFITGLTEAENETKGLFMGAVDYITKPFNEEIVRARVRTHLKIVHQMRMIEKLGMMDALTGLANRRNYDQAVKREWERAKREQKPISLLMADVDNFKLYNDTFGHPAGDVLLQKLAKVLGDHSRRSADLAARVGGEEFAVLYPDTDLETALRMGERIRTAMEGLMIPGGADPQKPVTISVGVVSATPGLHDSAADFIADCDKKLYKAKETGKNRVCY